MRNIISWIRSTKQLLSTKSFGIVLIGICQNKKSGMYGGLSEKRNGVRLVSLHDR